MRTKLGTYVFFRRFLKVSKEILKVALLLFELIQKFRI
jgi:hypothetical protein